MSEKAKKRNVWTSAEVMFFLSLIKEKQILGLMDGKRLRVNDIFKTLVGPMKEHGFIRDCPQLIVKYKNLKAEYYKAKRHNNVSGNNPYVFEFYDQMNEILGDRPVSQVTTNSQMGFDSSIEIIDDNSFHNLPENVEVEYLEDAPDPDGAIPGCSREEVIKVVSNSQTSYAVYKHRKAKKKPNNELQDYLEKCEENRKKEVEAEKEILNNFLQQQQMMLMNCDKFFINGMKDIFKEKKDDSDSD